LKNIKVKAVIALITFIIFSILLLQACLQTKVYTADRYAFRVSDKKLISFEELIDDLKKTTIIFVGESHDNRFHHQLQLDIIKALNLSNTPLAISFEMFTAESQNDLDQWITGTLPVEKFVKVYYKNWGFPWPLYKDILLYLRDNKIPAIGINVPAEISQKVASSGFSSLTKKELEKLPPEIGCAVDEKYINFIKRAYAAHGNTGKQFVHFCEAQQLWDKAMAWNLIEFLKKYPDKTVVVLTGNGHTWKRAIPEQVRTFSEKIHYRVIFPEMPGYIDTRNITIEDADYILLR